MLPTAKTHPLRKEHDMKSTGMVRKIDDLGRIVIPIEIRNNLDIRSRDAVEMFVDGDKIVLAKYNPACIFCGEAEDVTRFHDKLVCSKCIKELSK